MTETLAATDGNGTRSFAGHVVAVNAAGYGDGSNDGRVYASFGTNFMAASVNPATPIEILTIPIPLVALANGTVAQITPSFAGRIKKATLSVTQAGTGAGATVTLTPQIAGTPTTGGVVNPTLANTTLGAEVAGTAVTANNTFAAGQAITIVASAVTAFTGGYAQLNLHLG